MKKLLRIHPDALYDAEYIDHLIDTDDFKSPDARKLCQQWLQSQKNLATLQQQLAGLRDEYAQANRTRQRAMTQQILDLEHRVEELTSEVADAEKETRNTELSK